MAVGVLFVCLGNICRSPTAEGVFRALVEREGYGGRVVADSAGTRAYHIGSPPDARAQAAALARGIDIGQSRGRRVERKDFESFDYVLAMDRENERELALLAPLRQRRKLRLFLEFAPGLGLSGVPDPYSGGDDGFERVLDIVEAGCEGLFAHILEKHF